VFENEFTEFTEPEILKLPADGLVLQMKAMNIDKVVNFPFPTPPERPALFAAEKLLKLLGALDGSTGRITTLGSAMVKYPVAPRYAKMLCLARHYDCMPYVVAIVAALTVKELFVTDAAAELQRFESSIEQAAATIEVDSGLKSAAKAAMHQWRLMGISGGGDLAAMLYAVGASDHVLAERGNLEEFCTTKSLRHKAITEIVKLRKQLGKIGSSFGASAEESDPNDASAASAASGGKGDQLAPPTEKQLDATRQILLAGFGDNVARIHPVITPEMAKYNIHSYHCTATDEPVFIHPSSVLAKQKPDLIVYQELVQGKTKLYMKGVTVIHFDWLPRLVPSLCTFSKPLELPAPRYDAELDDIKCHMYGARFSAKFTLDDAIGSHACSLEANTRVTNGIPLGSSLLLPVDTVNFVQTLKVGCVR
jgi:ATP-dependent RNA helicase DHX37/DHR1